MIFLTSTNATVEFCERWATTTLRLPAPLWWSDDQGVFNSLLTTRDFYPVRAAGLTLTLVLTPALTLTLVLTPTLTLTPTRCAPPGSTVSSSTGHTAS